jgi:hypothetical protein
MFSEKKFIGKIEKLQDITEKRIALSVLLISFQTKCHEWVCFQKQICLFFCAYLICIEKRNNFVEENFSIQAFFL